MTVSTETQRPATTGTPTLQQLGLLVLGKCFSRALKEEATDARAMHGNIKGHYLKMFGAEEIDRLQRASLKPNGSTVPWHEIQDQQVLEARKKLPLMTEQNQRLSKVHEQLQPGAVSAVEAVINDETKGQEKRFAKYGRPFNPEADQVIKDLQKLLQRCRERFPRLGDANAEGFQSSFLLDLLMAS